jgi:hypothetical protein
MKRIRLYLMIIMVSIGALTTVNASEKNPTLAPSEIPSEIPPEIKVMLERLEEIKGMDKSELDRLEKKALRKEVRAIQSQIRTSGNGIYITTGALIVILLLIIIL